MVLPPVAPELAARLANYTIDDRARRAARVGGIARAASPHGHRRGDRRRRAAAAGRRGLPAELATNSGTSRSRNTRSCSRPNSPSPTLQCCRNTIDRESELGFEGRARMNAAAAVMRTCNRRAEAQHRFSPWKSPTGSTCSRRPIFFDLATTSTFYLQRVRDARRRGAR